MKSAPTQLKFQRVEAELRQLLRTLPIGAKLPGEIDLAKGCGCNFLTVRKALKQLVSEGVISRRVGSGTFICKHPADPAEAAARDRIGLFIYQKCNAYAHRQLQAVSQTALEQNLILRAVWTSDFSDHALHQAEMLKKDGCSALTIPWFPHERSEEIRSFIQRCPLPVSIPLLLPGLEKNAYFVAPATSGVPEISPTLGRCRYLYLLGHRNIAFLGPDSPEDIILLKALGAFASFTSRHQLPNHCGLVGQGAHAMDDLAERWKAYPEKLAIVCYDDEHALRFITSMHKLGRRAPDDYCILGFNDTDGSLYSDPPLSTFHQNFEEIALWLLKSARALAHGRLDQCKATERIKFLVRWSCGGRDSIDDALRSQIPEFQIEVDAQAPHPPRVLAGVTSPNLQTSPPETASRAEESTI